MVVLACARRALVAAALVLGLATPVAAQTRAGARNPYDTDLRRLAREAIRRGRSPRAILPLLSIWSDVERASPGVGEDVLDELARSRRLSPPVHVYAVTLHALMRMRAGDPEAAARVWDEMGYLRRWRVIGPFDNEGKAGFDQEMPPEVERNAEVGDAAEYPGRERPVRWRDYPDITRYGYVDFDALLRPFENVCGYAETFVHSERARPLSLWVGAGGAVKVWVNGELAVSDATYRAPDTDRSSAIFAARAGWNRILVKSCVMGQAWGFYLRLGDEHGAPVSGLRVDPHGATAASPAAPIRLPDPPEAVLAAFERAVAGDAEDAQAALDLAQYLAWTGADDPDEQRARTLAERACELAPSAEACLFAAGAATERAERLRWLTAAEAAGSDDSRVSLMRAAYVAGGPDPEAALPLLERIPATDRMGLSALSLRAALLSSLGFQRAALAIARDVADRSNGAVDYLRALVTRVLAVGRADEAMELRGRIVRARWDDFDARRSLVADALERGEADTVAEHVEAMRTAAPNDISTMYYAANVYDGLGREDEALAIHRAVVELLPDDPAAHVALGRRLLEHGQRDAAAASLRRGLALRPQDAATRELLEQIRPAERPDERFATPTEQILARRRRDGSFPVTVLHDLRVTSVFDNGLGSSFRQIAAQVHDAEGARRWRTFQIPFDPGTQWVDVRVAKVHRADGTTLEAIRTYESDLGGGYRVYYDRRALVVVFPDIEPGDVVELRYRVDDIAHRNVFDDYFGDLQILSGGDPIARLEYVLRVPLSRRIYFNEPQMRGLEHQQRVDGDQRVHRFVATDVPAIRSEPNMPGITEVAPYLHGSTYRTWEDVGRWWWGLVQDQLHPDASLERTVSELVQDAPDERTKVARIFEWVVRNTRYVGLEFGIHGFKPYRVSQVVRRGFGDCKDKASLLYVMLKLAGVDARIALVRTRHNGAIEDLPASLAVFDHAIAYVPSLDLWLDGTADHSGVRELPSQDQGVTALVVGPDGAELVRTPVLDAQHDRREQSLTIALSADGSATVDADELVQGGGAARYRSAYQAVNTRDERLQRQLAQSFPGIELLEHDFRDIDTLSVPVRFRWRGRVPQMAVRDRDGLSLAPSTLGGLTRALAPSASRRHAVDLGSPSAFVERRTVRIPAGFSLRAVPNGGEARSPFGRLAVRYERRDRTLRIETELEMLRDRVSVEEYPAFRRWLGEADALLRERIQLGGAQ